MQKQGNKTLCLVAGGSGGHITPALQLAKRWQEQNKSERIIFFCTKKKLDKKILSNTKLTRTIWISLNNIRFHPIFLLQFFYAFCKSLFFLSRYKPEKIISTGGHLAIPIVLAGAVLDIPIELHELNSTPGKTIKLLAPFARDIFTTFEQSKIFFSGATLEPYPLRFEKKDKVCDKNKIIKKIRAFDANKKTIFLLGGSQGSLFLNNTFKTHILKEKPLKNIQVLHQTGSVDRTQWEEFYKEQNIPAYTFSYEENIKDFYLLADVIIARGGAGTLFELAFFEKKSIIVPLKNHALNHQAKNAHAMAKLHPGLFTVYDQDFITKNSKQFFQTVIDQLSIMPAPKS